ncbi:thermonuclease family protein [Mesorhizobium sp. M8A.F.Ca.ET.208.01.1.1]|uniref:thermonuclease family protein n=1 Tax=unclassified Mesorhizobium TaxID=325217 RepID=UPI001093F133|nr:MULTISPECIES: thermonuclease family protein [unclassified Mesorhizobium]TGQ95444.1 thermonuclease family protein [Mesorhizobium sp. M8A.F.Ca.ET.208.01.1.1]TGT55935.1 thermonuclease family protein [Mesorhizobium sp. M8A.F.Ca.ET.167.01.1.1]
MLMVALLAAAFAIDGDTVILDGRHIRIANIDAPEIHDYKCAAELRLGLEAKARMAALLESGPLTVHEGDHGRMVDRYGRLLATIEVGGADVGEMLIAEGLARRWNGKRRPWCN